MTRSIKQAVVTPNVTIDKSKLLEEIALFNPDGTAYEGGSEPSNLHADLTDTDTEGHPSSAISYEAADPENWGEGFTEVNTALDFLAGSIVSSAPGWDLVIDEDGTSSANWSTTAGTWTATTSFNQTDVNAVDALYVYTGSDILTFPCIIEAEILIPTASYSNNDSLAGLALRKPVNGGSGGLVAAIGKAGGNPSLQAFYYGGAGITLSNAPTWGQDTWKTLRLVYTGGGFSMYVDSVLTHTCVFGGAAHQIGGIGLYSYRGAQFRNIKGYSYDLNLPA